MAQSQAVFKADLLAAADYDDMKMVDLTALKEEYDVILAKVSSDQGFEEWVRSAVSEALSSVSVADDDSTYHS